MQRLIDDAESRATDYPIDYEHQILESKTNGQPAPAAGWFRRLEARDDGLYAVDVRWTPRARQMIEAGEYRYISPVFSYDKTTGRITRLLMAAITNNPALDGLTDLAHLTNTLEELIMNESLAALAAHLKLEPDADAASAALARIRELEAEVEASKASAVPIGEHAKLQAEIATLRAEMEAAERCRLLDAGLADGRILPAQKDFWATQPLAALKAWLEIAQPLAALTETQSARVAQNAGKAPLTDEDRYVIEKLGLSEEAFTAAKARLMNSTLTKD